MNKEELTPEQNAAVERFVALITTKVDLATIEQALDASIWDITSYKLKDPLFTGCDGAETNIFWLRTLKEVFGGRVSWSI